MSKYQAVGYVRLSYTEAHSEESDSVINQKKLIQEFVSRQPDIELVSEQVDDGYSGVLFDRPAFQEMMAEIAAGTINCVIVKDLSRLGREYIETGRYLQQTFPAYGVRFISINDNIDTAHEHSGDHLHISLRTLLDDGYSHDISKKTRSALKSKRNNGDYVGACPIYGYQRDPDNKNHLVIDEYAAQVVRDIFRHRIDGYSAKKIADVLNEHGILSPLAYKVSRGLPHPTGGFADKADAKWSAQTVIRILADETYTGVLLQGRQETPNHKLKNLVRKPAGEWSRTENAHEPIIRRQEFELVKMISGLDTRTAPQGEEVYLFSGILICGCCGGHMTRKINTVKGKKYIYYYCPTGKKKGCSRPVMVKESDLVECVLHSAQAYIQNVVRLNELLDSINEEQLDRAEIVKLKAQIADNEARMDQARRFKSTIYESFIDGTIEKDEYRDLKARYTSQMGQAQEAIDRLREEMERTMDSTSARQRWAQHFKQFSAMTRLDRRAVIALIRSVKVLGKTEFDIAFRFELEYEAAKKRLSLAKEAG